jgi:uncharacterized protein YfaS (alpha-2-macroglobulin family)
MTFESSELIRYTKIVSDQNNFVIKEKLDNKFAPSFNITISYFYDRQFYSTSKLIGVLAKDKFLDISILPLKENMIDGTQIFKPGDEAEYIVSVKDYNGKPVNNTELSVGIIDESVYAIKEDPVQSIQNFFYAPSYSYIPTYTSLQRNYFNGQSRIATYLDKNYFKSSVNSYAGDGTLSGYVTFPQRGNDLGNAYIILSNDRHFYKTSIDINSHYKFSKIADGEYNLLVAWKNGTIIFISKVKTGKTFDINLDDFADKIPDENLVVEFDQRNEAGFMGDRMLEKSAKENSLSGMESILPTSSPQGAYKEAVVRSNFVDALIWQAHIVTDNKGTAKVKFEIPDNLTTWRTTVKAITKNSDAGQHVNKFISRKNLLVRMETPRFFREGDELIISSIVHNYLKQNKKTKISFKAENLELLDSELNSLEKNNVRLINKNEYEVTIDKNSELKIDWKVRVNTPIGNAKLTAFALTNEESDAIELNIPILPKGFKEVKSFTLDFSGNSTEEITFNIPADIDLRTVNLSFTINPSLAGTILKSLDDLVGYPYGCVEQTMSRFLPTIVAANAFKDINASLNASTIEELPAMVEAGLKRLYNFQHSDGGWGWWTNDATHPYMTAYVIYGMNLTKRAGYKTDENIFNAGVENLKRQIENYKGNPGSDETTLAYMIYSLTSALKGTSYNSDIYEELIRILLKENLNPYSLSLITISLKNMNNKELIDEAISRLNSMVIEESSYAYWEGKQWHYNWQEDKVQGTAFAIKALLAADENNQVVPKAVRWLMQQKHGYSWRSTQETASVIFALTDYLKITNELNPDFNSVVYINDQLVFDKYFSNKEVYTESKSIIISGLEDNILNHGTNKIKIVKKGQGKLYFSGLSEYYSKNQIAAAKINKFQISREYYLLKPEKVNDRIIYVKEKFDGSVKSGEDILVKTFVESKENNMQYFILEDMLPSGFEVVKDESYYEIEGENSYGYYNPWDYSRPWIWFYADKEYRDEKVSFFVTNTNDRMEFSYILKAQIPGKYSIMPANGYLMYYPEVTGNSEMIVIQVEDR